ncbi:MAG TPA: sulfatase-like hydrolase/transferase, partial [Thermoanaerobaculia bacterium]|nr:sulfatase-like hydrolase/transferase [Thermoanaerobaculia bacterium]
HLLLAVKLASIWARVDPIVESGYSALAFLGFVAFEDGSVLGLLVLALLVRGRPRLSGAAAGAVLAVYGLDVALQHALFARLTLPNLVQYAGELRFAAVVATPGAVLVAVAVSVGSWSLRRRRVPVPAPRVAVPLALALILLPALAARLRLHDPYLELAFSNVVRSNWQLLGSRRVPEESFEAARERHPGLWAGLVGGGLSTGSPSRPRPARPDLIVVVSESLSRVDSRRSGGLFDRLPRHDAMAARGATFTGLVSDGSNTTDALAALIAGEDPLPTPGVFAGMAEAFPRDPTGAHGAAASLVTVARRRGYETRFLSNAPLRFQANGAWLRRLGFGLVEGGEAEPYRARRGYSFGAAPDESVYARAAGVLAAEADRPLLLVLLTVSLHAPYEAPGRAAGEGSLASALRYADGAAGAFFDHLERSGYFESGYLLVAGDHRRMTPLEPEERRAFGLDALGRVFGCLVGPGIPEGLMVEAPLNHSDLHAVAADLVAGTFSSTGGFDPYNKGRRHGLQVDFTTHVVDGGRGLVLVRRAGRPLYSVRVPDLGERLAAGAEEDRRVAAYLAVRAGLLDRRRAPPPHSACPPPESTPLADRRCDALQRLFQTQRYLLSAAPDGFAYDPEGAREQVDGVFREAADAGTDGWRRAGAPAALALLSRLSALDAGAPRAAWLQGTYDLVAVAHAFEVLTHDRTAAVAASFPALDRLPERGRIVALWAGIRRTFRETLEAPRELPPGLPPRNPGSAPPAVVAHQGGLSRWPPSSLPALRSARGLGADGIEIDLRLAGDGEVFVLHDGLLPRPGEPGAPPVDVSRTAGVALRRLRLHDPFALDRPSAQAPIALRDVLRGFGGDLLLWLELKPDGGDGLPEAVGDLLAERPELLGSVVVSSLAPRMVRPLRARFPDLLVAYESGAIDPAAVEALAASPDADRLIVSSYHFPARSPEAFRRAQELGLRTSSFTVNRFDELEGALAAGVTYIQTDRPDRALWLRAQAPGER